MRCFAGHNREDRPVLRDSRLAGGYTRPSSAGTEAHGALPDRFSPKQIENRLSYTL